MAGMPVGGRSRYGVVRGGVLPEGDAPPAGGRIWYTGVGDGDTGAAAGAGAAAGGLGGASKLGARRLPGAPVLPAASVWRTLNV
jgi:hypothetical protein